jgi:hypothetical protein
MLATLLVLVLAQSCQEQPVPSSPLGYSWGLSTAPILWEAFFDHLCPDSLAAWPLMQQVVKAIPETVQVQIHVFPLPYHHSAFYAAQVNNFSASSLCALERLSGVCCASSQ